VGSPTKILWAKHHYCSKEMLALVATVTGPIAAHRNQKLFDVFYEIANLCITPSVRAL
jgi:hypothetical protein